MTPRKARMNYRKPLAILAGILTVGTLAACSASSVAGSNNARAADNFEIDRRIVFFNGITDTYLLEIQGRCSITDETGSEYGASQLEVMCKTGDDEYKKHMLGLSDNTSYFVEQTTPNKASEYHYRVIFRPQTIVPDVDIHTSAGNVG